MAPGSATLWKLLSWCWRQGPLPAGRVLFPACRRPGFPGDRASQPTASLLFILSSNESLLRVTYRHA